jgi:hypothetical protein
LSDEVVTHGLGTIIAGEIPKVLTSTYYSDKYDCWFITTVTVWKSCGIVWKVRDESVISGTAPVLTRNVWKRHEDEELWQIA